MIVQAAHRACVGRIPQIQGAECVLHDCWQQMLALMSICMSCSPYLHLSYLVVLPEPMRHYAGALLVMVPTLTF